MEYLKDLAKKELMLCAEKRTITEVLSMQTALLLVQDLGDIDFRKFIGELIDDFSDIVEVKINEMYIVNGE